MIFAINTTNKNHWTNKSKSRSVRLLIYIYSRMKIDRPKFELI